MRDINLVKENISKMIEQNAPESDIDQYVASEGYTPEILQNGQQPQASTQPEVQPQQERSIPVNIARGVPQGLGNAAIGAFQAATDVGEKAASLIERLYYGDNLQMNTFGDRLAEQVKLKNEQQAQLPTAEKVGIAIGQALPYLITGAGAGKAVATATGSNIAGLATGGAIGGAVSSALSPQETAGLENRAIEAVKGGATGLAVGGGFGVAGKVVNVIGKPVSKFTSSLIDRVKSELGNKEISKKIATEQLKSGLAKEGIDIFEALKQTSQEGKDLVDILDPRFATLNQGLKNLNRPETIKIADQSLAKISDTTNKLQNKIVNLISEKKISLDQAGEILGRNSQKIFNEALQARRAKAAPLYRKGLESGTKIDLDTVLTQNTAEISDLLGVAEKKLTLKNLLNSPVIKNSISQARIKSLEFANSPSEDIYGKIYQKTKPVYQSKQVFTGRDNFTAAPIYKTETTLKTPSGYKIPDNDIRVLHAVDNILYDRINEIAQTGATKEQTALGIIRKSIGNLLDNSNNDLAKARRLWQKDTENLTFAKNSLIGKYAKYYKEGRTDELTKAAMNVLDLPTNKIVKARQANPQEFNELLRSSIENKIASIQPLDDGVINPKAFTKAFFSDGGKNLEAAVGGDKGIVKGFKNLAENLDIKFQRNRITKSAMESQAKSVRIPTGKTSAANRVFEFVENRLVSSPEVQKEFVSGLFTSEGQQMLKTIASSEKKVQEQIVDNFIKKIIITSSITQTINQ
jgi:predicted HTH domain antitoxin